WSRRRSRCIARAWGACWSWAAHRCGRLPCATAWYPLFWRSTTCTPSASKSARVPRSRGRGPNWAPRASLRSCCPWRTASCGRACTACALLFPDGTRLLRVRPRAELLADFQLSDTQWDALRLPIGLAFFLRTASRVTAFYPGPAGATESLVPLDAWEEIARLNALELQRDVEALLVNRVGAAREHYLVSVDQCYRLVGILRRSWRGFSGGEEVWERIGQFFSELKGGARA